MVVGSATAFAGVFTFHADGFVVVVVATAGAVVSSVGVAGGTIPSFALTTTTATQHKGF